MLCQPSSIKNLDPASLVDPCLCHYTLDLSSGSVTFITFHLVKLSLSWNVKNPGP